MITIRELDKAIWKYEALSGRKAKLIELPLDDRLSLLRTLREISGVEYLDNGCFYYAGIPVVRASFFRISDRDIFGCTYCGIPKETEREFCSKCGAPYERI